MERGEPALLIKLSDECVWTDEDEWQSISSCSLKDEVALSEPLPFQEIVKWFQGMPDQGWTSV